MPRYQYVVLTQAKPGREADFEAWYRDQHIVDVARVPGVVSARRFHVDQIIGSPCDAAWVNLAIYEIESENPQDVLAAIKARANTSDMPLSDDIVASQTLHLIAS